MKRQSKRRVAVPPATVGGVTPRASAGWNWWLGIFLIVATLVVYWPALHGGFIWDDDDHISTNATLRSLSGLWDIWFKPGATCQYYPLTFTWFWAGYQLWGLNPLGYHLLNVVMHGVVAVLLWQVLARLKVRGAWLAGAIFALHPVCVMSVAWMTELKNTLSASLALAAMWAYVRFAGVGIYGKQAANIEHRTSNFQHPMDWRFYGLALGLFQLAMFAKTAVSFVPVTLLLLVWWQRKQIGWRDVWPLLPMVGIVVVMGQVTIYVERATGATGPGYSLGFVERVLVSGRSFWFYLGKLFFPYHLTFIYERWEVNARVWWQYVYPAATAGLLGGAWLLRNRIGKGPFVALLHFYVSTSLLVLLVVLFMTRYSWVTDHWQYFGCMSVIALTAAGIATGLESLGKRNVQVMFTGGLLLLLGVLTWRQCGIYGDIETLWRTNIARNPNSSMVHNNLGSCLIAQGRKEEARECLNKALEIDPGNVEAHFNLALVLDEAGRVEEAISQYRETLRLKPGDAEAYGKLAALLHKAGRLDEAIHNYEEALKLAPNDPRTHNNLGTAFGRVGRLADAVGQFEAALRLKPEYAEAQNNLGHTLVIEGKLDEAVQHFERSLQIKPEYAQAHFDLAGALTKQGRWNEALPHFQQAVDLAQSQGNSGLAAAARVQLDVCQSAVRERQPH